VTDLEKLKGASEMNAKDSKNSTNGVLPAGGPPRNPPPGAVAPGNPANAPPAAAAPGQPANAFQFGCTPWQKMAPPRNKGFAAATAVSVLSGLAVFAVACYYLRPPQPPPPPPARPVAVVRELPRIAESAVKPPVTPAELPPLPPPPEPAVVVREVPKVVERVVEVPVLRAEPPRPPPPPPEPPPPPPQPWAGIWRSAQSKATLRLSQTRAGIEGYYSPANGNFAPGDLERVVLSGDRLSFSVVLGTRRHGMRMERDGDTAMVFKWVDIDGLREEYRKLDQMVAQRHATVQQALIVRRQIQEALRTAGPQHEKLLGTFTREEAPSMTGMPTLRRVP
jgi:hypothetical protein